MSGFFAAPPVLTVKSRHNYLAVFYVANKKAPCGAFLLFPSLG